MSVFFRHRLCLLALLLALPWAGPVCAETALESVRITSRLDLNSILISGVDIVFFYDDSIAGTEPMTAFSWYSRKRELREQIFHLRLQQAGGQLEKPSELRSLRREVARIETVLTQKNNSAVSAAK